MDRTRRCERQVTVNLRVDVVCDRERRDCDAQEFEAAPPLPSRNGAV
jgi:hypothetical protein